MYSTFKDMFRVRLCCVTVDTTGAPLYIKRERDAGAEHKALLHGILSQHPATAAALLSYNTGKYSI